MANANLKHALDAATQYIMARRVKQGKTTIKEQTDFIINHFLKELAA
jgi:hypothetical protein